MALFVYPTTRMLADARNQGVALARIQDFCDTVEKSQSISTFERFPPPFLTRKKIWRSNNRLIAAEHSVGDNLVILLLGLVAKSSRDYAGKFTVNPHDYAGPLLQAALPEMTAWLADRTQADPPPSLRAPSASEHAFLWAGPGTEAGGDTIVCETAHWLRASQHSHIQDRFVYLPEFLLSLAHGDERGPCVAQVPGDPRLKVGYCWHAANRQLLLLDVAYDRDIDAKARHAEYLSTIPPGERYDPLRITRRTYPILVCCDTDMWIAIQRDAAANMALSPEEITILRSVRPTPHRTGFPLFINGRAGSGKSTLLQYLFADYFAAWATHLMPNDDYSSTLPLYLASSHELLATAKAAVRSLLHANAERILNHDPLPAAAVSLLDSAFRTPIQYLSDAIASNGGRTRFEPGSYVHYPRFRRLWYDRFAHDRRAQREYGPQLSWHVIRTHIKGQSAEAELEPADFAALPRNEHTVSKQRYKTIFDHVWTGWYEPLCKENGYWDDQDVAAEAVRQDYAGRHAALFCDESQDFTRRQLEALRRACGFSFLQLTPEDAARVPFVFAGDPFQTLNPTGFRWDAIRAAFTEKIAGNLYRCRRRTQLPNINYRELAYNYRSSPHVVRLCNSIQAVRAVVMDERSLRPQTTWLMDTHAPPPMFFDARAPALQSDIRQQTDLVLVVPCDEGGESEYVQAHPAIEAIVRRGDDGIPQNVLSPARAKGLEFNRVAVVGFGSTPEAVELAKCLEDAEHLEALDTDARLPLEYFLNTLYVACSRARRRLFIIEELDDLKPLWGFALDRDTLDDLCSRIPASNGSWNQHVGYVVNGLPEHWQDDHNDPSETADRFKAEGESNDDPYLLKLASQQYDVAGEVVKAHGCQGQAFVLEGEWRKAGDSFLAAGETRRALESFWADQAYERVLEAASRDASLHSLLEYRLAEFLLAPTGNVNTAIQFLCAITERGAKSKPFERDLSLKGWARAIRDLLTRASAASEKPIQQAQWNTIAQVHDDLVGLGVHVGLSQRAEALVNAQRYEQVFDLLSEKPGHKWFRQAKLEWARRERKADRLGNISPDDKKLVGDVLRSERAFDEARFWYQAAASRQGLEVCIQDLAEEQAHTAADPFIVALAQLACHEDDWEYILDLITGKGWPKLSKRGRSLLKQRSDRLPLATETVLPVIAVSESVLAVRPEVRDRLAQVVKTAVPSTDRNWNDDKTRERCLQAAAAIERIGKDIDALTRYETIYDDHTCPTALRAHARQRWIHCKRRQAQRERAEGRATRADRHLAKAEAIVDTYSWTQADLGPPFPDKSMLERIAARQVPQAKTTTTAGQDPPIAQPDQWTLAHLQFQWFRKNLRINITSSTGEQARIDLGGVTLLSSDVEVRKLGPDRWVIDEWRLQARFGRDGGALALTVGTEEKRIDLTRC